MKGRLAPWLRSPCIFLGLIIALLLGTLVVDIHRVTSQTIRVQVADPAVRDLLEAQLPFGIAYVSRVVDEVPRMEGLLLLPRFERHTQIVLVNRYAILSQSVRAALIASHAPVYAKNHELQFGLDHAAREWLAIDFAQASPEQITSLTTHAHPSAKRMSDSKKP